MKTALFALLLLSACTAAPKPARPDVRHEALERRVSTLLEERAALEARLTQLLEERAVKNWKAAEGKRLLRG